MNSGSPRSKRRFLRRGIAWLVFCVCLAVLAAAQTKGVPSQSPLGQISGHVYRSDTGEPVPKAQVELNGDEQTGKALGGQRIVSTSTDGAFIFSDLPAGKYQIDVWRNGFTEYPTQQRTEQAPDRNRESVVTLEPGEKLENLTLRLHPAGVIAGKISDADQDAVSGIEVDALFVKFVRGGRKQVSERGRAVTDDLGNFRIANLPPGSYLLRAGGLIARPLEEVGLKQGPAGGVQYRNTYYPGTAVLDEAQALQVNPEATTEIQLAVPTERTYTITGKVLPKPGSTLGHVADIECSSHDTEGYMFSDGSQTTDIGTDGSFRISRLPPGDYTLSTLSVHQGGQSEPGYGGVHIVDSDVHVNVEIGRTIEVRGNVEALKGSSVAGQEIALETFGPGFYLFHKAPVDAKGRFVIDKIPPGEFTFTVWGADDQASSYVKKAVCGGRDYATTLFTLALDTTLDCDVTLANDVGEVHGKVMNGDKPATHVVTVLIPESKELRRIPRYTLTSKTDAAGDYKIAGVIPGDYLLFAVPRTNDNRHLAPDFADNHGESAEKVSLTPRAVQAADLKLLTLE